MAISDAAWDLSKLMRDEIGDRSADAILGANPFVGLDPTEMLADVARLMGRALLRPEMLAQHARQFVGEFGRILVGRSELEPAAGDRRFADPSWRDHPLYRRWMQAYLVSSQNLRQVVGEVGFDEKSAQRADFAVGLLTEAMAPTNFMLGNPAALKRAFETGGLSLLRGARHWFDDLRRNGGMPSQVDTRPFRVGKTLATTPGSVVHRSELLELIQYAPATEAVRTRPLLIVPPLINKYYILDLAPGRSFIEYTLKHEHQVFTLSWRNPGPEHRDWDMAAYVRAIEEAIEVTSEITGSEDLNILGACAGGITTAILMGHLAAAGVPRLHSATLLVTVLDTEVPSMTGIFASERAIQTARKRSARRGVLAGDELARVFAWLRPNDLVWNYWVNNYLMGNDPPAFDILSWNNDYTNLPAGLHSDFLSLFQENPLLKPGGLSMLGTSIDLSRIQYESYVVGALTDHITPWKACFRTPALLGGKSQFVLSSSGHIQALVNPPGNPKSRYLTADENGAGDRSLEAEVWLKRATQHSGTWWDHWLAWLGKQAAQTRTAPPAPGSSLHPALAPAPGQYVRQ